jgi:thiamine pyrophosphokinase
MTEDTPIAEKIALLVCPLADPRIEAPVLAYNLRIAVDGGGAWFAARGETPDALIGDMDSLPAAIAARFRAAGIEVLEIPVDKDFSDLDIALDCCVELGITDVVILGAIGARLDHQLAVLGAFSARPGLSATLIGDKQILTTIKEGESVHLRNPGQTFSVLAPQGAVVSVSGAKWNLDHTALAPFSSRGLSNQVGPGEAVIQSHKSPLFIITIA